MKRLVRWVLVSAMLSSGCAHKQVIPDPTVPHQVAEEVEIKVWADASDGTKVKTKVRLLKGWWVASPQVVE